MLRCNSSISSAVTDPAAHAEGWENTEKRWKLLAMSEESGRVHNLCESLTTQDVRRLLSFARKLISQHGPRKRLTHPAPRGQYLVRPSEPLTPTQRSKAAQCSGVGQDVSLWDSFPKVRESSETSTEASGPEPEGSLSDDTPPYSIGNSRGCTPTHGLSPMHTTPPLTSGTHTESTAQDSLPGENETGPSFSYNRESPERALDPAGDLEVPEPNGLDEVEDRYREDSIELEKYWTYDENTRRYYHIDQRPEGPVRVWYPEDFD